VRYDEFRRLRDELLQTRRPLRLDCMNPERALASWVDGIVPRPSTGGPATLDRAISAWSDAAGWLPDTPSIVAGQGIRELLAGVMDHERGRLDELWLPADVYPVYGDLARAAGHAPRSFATLPEPDWTFLDRTAARSGLLLPIPLSPRGRLPTPTELDALIRWLERTPESLLMVDAAYTYEFSACRPMTQALFETGRCILLWSCSKPWLLSRSLGLAAMPASRASSLRDRIAPPSASAMAAVVSRLEGLPDLPRRQQAAFRREWSRIEPRVRAIVPEWRPPETGYFSVVARPFSEVLERFDMLGVPASVFGSGAERTVVTCLHDLALHESGAA
jgi:histidinol-phosphate/aromatic aminotransferase/cobyric acid decarboxylase-like protein